MKQLVHTSVFLCIFGIFLLRGWLFDSYYFIQGQRYYDAGVYSGAIVEFGQISDTSVSLHNTGNTFFQEYLSSWQDDTNLLSLALQAYSGSLSLEENPDTRYNYEKVLEYFSQEQTSEAEQESKTEDQKTDSSETQQAENEEQQGQTWEDTTKQEHDSQTWQDTPESNSWSQDSGEQGSGFVQEQDTPELSPSQNQELRNYIQSLQREQVQNQQFYGKQPFQRENIFDKYFWGGERDW